MRGFSLAILLVSALLAAGHVCAAESDTLDSAKVVSLTRFLEVHPLDKQAAPIRSVLLQWEEDSEDVVDVVCPGVFAPLPDATNKYNSELLAQFIFGSAAHQLAVPADKGKLLSAQVAGMTSMLKAYRAFLIADKEARIPRFDALSRTEAIGSLAGTLEPLVIANCLPGQTSTSRFPWTFGMSKAQVTALKGYGPYRNFKNGDVETYNAVFDGHVRNFQFFFREQQLRRISVSAYEGNDLAAATQAWGDLYESMKRHFGSMETPANKVPSEGNADDMKAFETVARTLVAHGGKAQMAPLQQPVDVFSFASFAVQETQGTTQYLVVLYFDPPHEVAKPAVAGEDRRL